MSFRKTIANMSKIHGVGKPSSGNIRSQLPTKNRINPIPSQLPKNTPINPSRLTGNFFRLRGIYGGQ